MQDVLVPQMGESVLEGTILEWKVKVGDRVEINQPLVELMTDKVNVEIPAETAGILTEQCAAEGEVIPVGTRIAVIDDGQGSSGSSATKSVQSPVKEKKASKAAPEVPTNSIPVAIKSTAPLGKGRMSPKVRMMMREYGLDPSTIQATGKDGLVTADDVMRTVETRSADAGFTAEPIPSPKTPPLFAKSSSAVKAETTEEIQPQVNIDIPIFAPLPDAQRETRMPLVGARKAIADHMVKSLATSSHVTTFEEIDFTDLVKFRNSIKSSFNQTYGVNITFMPFIIKAVCVALKEFPTLNASMTDTEIILKNNYNIGIAVARDEGLIVPVIKDADRKTIIELAVEINQLGEKARTNRLMPDDVAGGTFSLTNAGMFGATSSTPIISQPQVAILGIHAITKRPWVVGENIVVRDISTFGLSFDHRLIDGHTAVQFLHRVHQYLADSTGLLLNLR